MRRLLLMRHGEAELDAASGLDADRALTASGRRVTGAVSLQIRNAVPVVDLLVTSPLLRARQTADIVASDREVRQRIESRLFVPTGDPATALLWLQEQAGSCVMLVGHEPQLSAMAAIAVGASGRQPLVFETATVCALSAVGWGRDRSSVLWHCAPDLAGDPETR